MPKSKKKPTKSARGTRVLNSTLYVYCQKANALHARAMGKSKKYGSFSAYVDALISKERGVKAPIGLRGQSHSKV